MKAFSQVRIYPIQQNSLLYEKYSSKCKSKTSMLHNFVIFPSISVIKIYYKVMLGISSVVMLDTSYLLYVGSILQLMNSVKLLSEALTVGSLETFWQRKHGDCCLGALGNLLQ